MNIPDRLGYSPKLSRWFSLVCNVEASALLEFAVALPLLVVMVVGIFDFGGAFNMKQELNNAMREAAHLGASQPTNDLFWSSPGSCAAPGSVCAIRDLIVNYMAAAGINDCGLASQTASGSGFNWTFTPTSCVKTLTVTINRAAPFVEPGSSVTLVCTQVTIAYPYQWRFGKVIQLLIPSANFGSPEISTSATAANLN